MLSRVLTDTELMNYVRYETNKFFGVYMTELEEEALQFVRRIDESEGPAWSEDSEAIAKNIAKFSKIITDEIADIVEKSTPNRRYFKKWEIRILKMCGRNIDE